MKKVLANLWWSLLTVAGAWAYATLALHRGEALNSVYILIAALCSYSIGYRFYSKWLVARAASPEGLEPQACKLEVDF
jgi:carbon starvation protein